jgi:hypothetical protein
MAPPEDAGLFLCGRLRGGLGWVSERAFVSAPSAKRRGVSDSDVPAAFPSDRFVGDCGVQTLIQEGARPKFRYLPIVVGYSPSTEGTCGRHT